VIERALIMAGGTGGHVFPALAVATELKRAGLELSWLGAKGGMEESLVTDPDIQLHLINVSGLRGKGITAKIAAPWRLTRAIWQANMVFSRVNPSVVIGFGGFASGPGGFVAWLRRRRLVIHEQNAVAGTTNRILRRFADRVLEAFPGSLPGAELVGNPVRGDVEGIPAPQDRLAGRDGSYRVLVLGGSQGARFLNQHIPAALSQSGKPIEVWHQCGNGWLDETRSSYEQVGLDARVESFIDDMAAAYSWADLVICRAGAMTVAELAAAGAASLLVPFPYAIDDHQTANANWLAEAGGAGLIQESEASKQGLADTVRDVLDRGRLLAMAAAARTRANKAAAARIADICRGGA
jgi:UDP-N-acetylglucosamine--N-acetylmuramyl-(pentapeptide) pyrophosphoryl-undecaprenol N-acetylglucosamine transferase